MAVGHRTRCPRRRRADAVMAARDLTSELAYLTRALKAPTLRDAVSRLAERARAESWTHEEFLAACLQREVAACESYGGEGRIRAARFPARKSLEEFDFDHGDSPFSPRALTARQSGCSRRSSWSAARRLPPHRSRSRSCNPTWTSARR